MHKIRQNNSVILHAIRNTTCITCGKPFQVPRAGKIYCSPKCKQFSFYHKEEIKSLQASTREINNSVIRLPLRAFESYNSTVLNLNEFQELQRRQTNIYRPLESHHLTRLEHLQKSLPTYLQTIKLRKLSLEEWSFIRILFKDLKKDQFLKIISRLDYSFFENLKVSDPAVKNSKVNSIQILFANHCLKIAEGKIIFL
jgi:uncharacterized Zn finger protein (UPF0148 family)